MATEGTIWVEDRRIKQGIKNLRITESVLKAFPNALRTSKEGKTVASWREELGCIVVAVTMWMDKFKLTGKTEF